MNFSPVRQTASSVFMVAVLASTAHAQTYPSKSIRMIVPFAPGGNTDIIARIVSPEMSRSLGQQLIIDNRGGAGSIIGTEMASKAPADGYTLLMVSAAHTINPAMTKKLPYDSIRDFASISMVADVPTAFVIHPTLPVKNVREFIALARARPGQLNYSTAGRGTVGHLSAELLSSMEKITLVHAPYKGSGPSLIDLMAGQVQLQFSSMPAVVNYVRAGKMRMIAQTGKTRSSAARDVPTMEEAGVKGFIVSSGFGLYGPANMPRPLVDRVYGSLKAALGNADVRNNLLAQGAEPVGSSPEEFATFTRNEIAKWIKVSRDAGIPPE